MPGHCAKITATEWYVWSDPWTYVICTTKMCCHGVASSLNPCTIPFYCEPGDPAKK